MEARGDTPGFGPVASEGATALILGTYPSPKSFDAGFYYGHPQNRFWPLLASLSGRCVPVSIEEKRALLQAMGLTLWDVLERCSIKGAQDASIRNAVPNDVAGLLRQTGIARVYCNGAAAAALYARHCLPHTGVAPVRLPSTSPANAACSFAKLAAAWQVILAPQAAAPSS